MAHSYQLKHIKNKNITVYINVPVSKTTFIKERRKIIQRKLWADKVESNTHQLSIMPAQQCSFNQAYHDTMRKINIVCNMQRQMLHVRGEASDINKSRHFAFKTIERDQQSEFESTLKDVPEPRAKAEEVTLHGLGPQGRNFKTHPVNKYTANM